MGYTCFGHFKYLSPHNYEVSAAPLLACARFPFLVPRLDPVSALTLALKVKEEDEDATDGVDESSTVLQTMQYNHLTKTQYNN